MEGRGRGRGRVREGVGKRGEMTQILHARMNKINWLKVWLKQ
jgi:hypothetical protein